MFRIFKKAIKPSWLLPDRICTLIYLYLCFGNWENLKPTFEQSLNVTLVVNCVNVPAEAVWCRFFMSPLLYKDTRLYFTVLYFFWLWEQILFFCDSFRVCWTFFDVTELFCNSLWNLLCNFVVQQLKSTCMKRPCNVALTAVNTVNSLLYFSSFYQ